MSTPTPKWLENRTNQYNQQQEAMGHFLRKLRRGENDFLFDHVARAAVIADEVIDAFSVTLLHDEAVEIAREKLGLDVSAETTYGEAATLFAELEKNAEAHEAFGADSRGRVTTGAL